MGGAVGQGSHLGRMEERRLGSRARGRRQASTRRGVPRATAGPVVLFVPSPDLREGRGVSD